MHEQGDVMDAEQTMLPSVGFDYGELAPELRPVVVEHTQAIHRLARRSAQDIIEIGGHLHEVKAEVGHGQFLAWLRAEFDWSDQTARNFMSVAALAKSQNFGDLQALGPSVLYLLAQPSTPVEVRDDILARTANGERVPYAEARQAIQDARAPTPLPPILYETPMPLPPVSAYRVVETTCEDCGTPCREAALVDSPDLCDDCAEQRYCGPSPETPLVEWPEEEHESGEEKAFYALARGRLVCRFAPEQIAAAAPNPAADLPGFVEFAAWLTGFVAALEDRTRLRVAK